MRIQTTAGTTAVSDACSVRIRVTEEEEEQPAFRCVDLKATPTQGKPPLKVTFTATAEVSDGVDILEYIWDFDDNDSQSVTKSNTTTHTYTELGTHTASVIIRTSEGLTKPSANCKVKITLSEEELPPPPVVPPVTPPTSELPNTGPAETAAGVMGSAGLGFGIRNYLRSKRGLLKALLGDQ